MLAVAGVLTGACADADEARAPSGRTPRPRWSRQTPPPSALVTAADDAPVLVAVAAEWQCDLQRFAFDSLSDLDELLAETLASRGVTVAEFEAFELELESRHRAAGTGPRRVRGGLPRGVGRSAGVGGDTRAADDDTGPSPGGPPRHADVFDLKTRLFSSHQQRCWSSAWPNPALADDDDDREPSQRQGAAPHTARPRPSPPVDTAWLGINWTAKDGPVSDFSMVLARGAQVRRAGRVPHEHRELHGPDERPPARRGRDRLLRSAGDGPGRLLQEARRPSSSTWPTPTSTATTTTRSSRSRSPVVQYTAGEHLVQHDSTAEIAPGTSVWVGVDFTGLAPCRRRPVDGGSRATCPSLYPSYGSATSLHGDSRLDDGETDTARFRVDVGDAAPGSYEVSTENHLRGGGRALHPVGLW